MKRRLLKTVTAAVLSVGMVVCPMGGYIPDSGNVMVAYADDMEHEGFKYKVVDDSYVEITGYTGSEKEIVIPEKIDGYNVESIGDSVFFNENNLTSISIPNCVKNIGNHTFCNCSNLLKISFPESLKYIGESAFWGCSSITNITIPDSVISIGEDAFVYCSNLDSIKVSSNNTFYDSRNDCNALIETDTNKIIRGCSSTILLDSVTSIENRAFYGCTNLKDIQIPNSINSIGYEAFKECSSITNITIPESISIIESGTFEYCINLTNITLANSITNFKDYAFRDCKSLKKIIIPDTVQSIGESVFLGCISLSDIEVDSKNDVYDSRNNSNAIIETSKNKVILGCCNTFIPNSVTSIDNNAFLNCIGLKDIKIPDSVKSIGYAAFSGCINLKNITIPESVTYIGNCAFEKCSNVKIKCSKKSYAYKWAKRNGVMTDCEENTDSKLTNSIIGKFNYKKISSTKNSTFNFDIKATGGIIKYKSNNSKVKVTGSGKVTIAKNFVGTAVITVTAGNSDYETVTKKITIKVLPPSTKITTAKNNAKGKLTVKWSKVSNVTGYDLQYSTNASFKTGVKTLLNKKASTTSKVITKLAKGNTYYVRIRTFKKASGKNIYSAWSAKTKVKIKK